MNQAQHGPSHCIAQELVSARELLECLQQEQSQLIQADIAALALCAERKNILVARMAALALARTRALSTAAHAPTDAGMLAWLATQEDDVREDWHALLAVAAAGKELNRTNGLLIHQHLNRNQVALQALRGGGQAAVYGRDGQQNVNTAGRRFVAG